MEITDKNDILALLHYRLTHAEDNAAVKQIMEDVKHGHYEHCRFGRWNPYNVYPIRHYEHYERYFNITVSVDDNNEIEINLNMHPSICIPGVTTVKYKNALTIFTNIVSYIFKKDPTLLKEIDPTTNTRKIVSDKTEKYYMLNKKGNFEEMVTVLAEFIKYVNDIADVVYTKNVDNNSVNILKPGDKIFLKYLYGMPVKDDMNNEIYAVYLGNNIIKSKGIKGTFDNVTTILMNEYGRYPDRTFYNLNGLWYWYLNNVAIGEYQLLNEN